MGWNTNRGEIRMYTYSHSIQTSTHSQAHEHTRKRALSHTSTYINVQTYIHTLTPITIGVFIYHIPIHTYYQTPAQQ